MTLSQFRTTVEAGGILSVTLKGNGSGFAIMGETRRGDAVLIDQRKKQPRLFADPRKALGILREMGIQKATIDAEAWRPEQAAMDRPSRPDRAVVMKAAHEAAALKALLEDRLRQADDPNTVWHDHDPLFDELEAGLAD